MPSVFTLIINGDIPGRFVWKDDRCVAFLSINPLQPGHTLVVPREEVDHWVDLDPDLVGHLMQVAQSIGRVQRDVFSPNRIGLLIVGDEVPHVHLHVVPIRQFRDLDFALAEQEPDPAALDDAARRLRAGLRAAGHAEATDGD
jgi:diadenosine tetraphosphate (Ap4A) HIT family hydrolase